MPIEEPELNRMAGNPWRQPVPPTCPACGYNLTGVPSARCPECGRRFHRRELEQRARELSMEATRLKDVNELPRVGLWTGGVGLALLGLGVLSGFRTAAGLAGVVLSVVTLGFGASVFRILRLPDWMIAELPSRPNYPLGVSVACLGLLLLILSLVTA